MNSSIHTCPGRVRQKVGAILAASALAIGLGFFSATPAEGNPPQDDAALKIKAEIEALAARCAAGVDAIGRGDVEEGRQILASCFTEDVLWESWLPLHDPDEPAAFTFVGVNGFADGVNDIFVFFGVQATHHQIGNVQISVHGNTATMKSYVTAYHIIDSSSSVDMATAVYTDHVVKTPGGWRIARRATHATSFLHLSGSPGQLP